MMRTINGLAELRSQIEAWRGQGLRIGFVPTMGNLHEGHYALVEQARRHAQKVVVSIFVNPTQFGPGEDFAQYPRTPEADASGLQQRGADLLFLPSIQTMYPFGPEARVQIHVTGISDILEGAHRAGHFDGVATVVARLMGMVQPDIAVFGRKDYQQLQLVRRLLTDLAMPVEVIAAETVREPDGLAMSSRNQYLSPEERSAAPLLHAALRDMDAARRRGMELEAIEVEARARLQRSGFVVDYAVLRRADLSQPDSAGERGLIALAAARLGRTRLIDNLSLLDS
jgi:pantoate--beta-alanine ligase